MTTIVGQVHGPPSVLGETGDPHTTFDLDRMQPADIGITVGHGGPRIGSIVHLERALDGSLWGVGTVDTKVLPNLGEYWSPRIVGIHTRAGHCDHLDDAAIGHVACVYSAAGRVQPWRTTPADLDREPRPLGWPEYELDLVARAANHHAQRRRSRRSSSWQLIHEAPPNRHLEKIYDAELAAVHAHNERVQQNKLAEVLARVPPPGTRIRRFMPGATLRLR